MVACNSFDIYMFILSRTARRCQYLINSAFFRFSGVAKNRPQSLYLRLLLVASLLILGYDATASFNISETVQDRHIVTMEG